MIEAEWWEYDSLTELADAVAGDVGFIIDSAVDARGTSLIAVPGGSTGPAIFPKLVAQKLPWKKVTIIPTDDRIVPMEDERSNVRAIAKTFLPAGARVIPIAADIADYRLAGNSADARLQDLPWPPDLVWLGMGKDGHTASIFAGPDLQDALDAPKARRAIGVMPDPLPPEAPVARVTLTRAAILSARTDMITITGEEKRKLLEQAIADGQSSKLPIGRVLAEVEQPIDIHWCP
jgi:6-phosphogluconolactonase